MKRWWRWLFGLGVLAAGLPFLWIVGVRLWVGDRIMPASSAPTETVAIVFGARVYPDGRLSAMLRDRVETAVELYELGRVDKLIMSGDNRFEDYNEPDAMRDYAVSLGVPFEAIQPDYAGRRTYDTCYRAKEIFQLERAILVTQEFHLPRAIFTCDGLGLEVTGVIGDRQQYSRRSLTFSLVREVPATLLALVDVVRGQPAEILGDPIPLTEK